MKQRSNEETMQKIVCISYDSMEELLNRELHITNTLQNYLDRSNNEQYIQNTDISITDDDKYLLTFTLAVTE